MTVLRLIRYQSDLPVDIELDDVIEISAEASGGGPAVVVEADNGPRDNYRYFANSVKIIDRNPDSHISFHQK